MISRKIQFVIYTMVILVTSCTSSEPHNISGSIDYLGDAALVIEYPSVHYKYAPKDRDTISVNSEGAFNYSIQNDFEGIAHLIINDDQYPLYVNPESNIKIDIERSEFPQKVDITGYPEDLSESYHKFAETAARVESELDAVEEEFKNGKTDSTLKFAEQKLNAARDYLKNTSLHPIYLKTIGEYLVLKIRSVEYRQRADSDFNADSARSAVIDEARNLNFFTHESLLAQRAGIRDLAHYYARTFEIYDSVKAEHGDISEYDIKRLAYEPLNDKRVSLLKYMESRDAEAHARMYLVAERIGEQNLDKAVPSYETYLAEFQNYPQYTDFLKTFYEDIKSVSPGEPAVDFSLPDIDGNTYSMDDFKGKYVLLDFWAGWCQPCLDEFEDMNRLYDKYSRDNFEIVAISNEIDSLVWVQDIKRFDNPWIQLYSGDGFEEETFKAYKGGGIPFYILINPEGNIERYNDVRPSFNLDTVLDSLINS